MAQAIGVWSGWHGRQSAKPPQLGMLLGGRAIHCELPAFPAGSELVVRVQQLLKDEKLASFECEISIDNVPIAQGRLNTYQPDQQEIIQLTTLRGDA